MPTSRKEECISKENFPRLPKPTIHDKLQVGKLLSIKRVEQRTPEWYALRMTMITASDWATAIGEGKSSKITDIILKKCGKGPKFKGNIFTEWGTKYEDVATRLYELRNKTKVYEFGVLKHPVYLFLGASPDGITPQGIMLEIKCPFCRIITGIVPRYYWIQIQGQLEVCNLTYCDFLECKISEYSGIEEYLEDTEENPPVREYKVSDELYQKFKNGHVFNRTKDAFEKGAVITYNTPEGDNKYFYSELGVSKKEFNAWHEKIKKEAPKDWVERRINFWRFDKISCVRVTRDPNWFKEALPKLQETWNQVDHYKKVGCKSLLKNVSEEDMIEDADIQEINALITNHDGYDDFDFDLQEPEEQERKSLIVSNDEFDFDLPEGPEEVKEPEVKEPEVKEEEVKEPVKKNLKKGNVTLNIRDVFEKKVLPKPPYPNMSRRSTNDDKWDGVQLEAIFDLEVGSWLLPKYIPLNPVVTDKRSIEEFKMNFAGTCKLVSRCKSALSKLSKCPAKLIDDSEINIRNIVHMVNNWISGLPKFLEDTLKDLEFDIPKDLKSSITNTIENSKKWTDKLHPKWLAKWSESESESD